MGLSFLLIFQAIFFIFPEYLDDNQNRRELD